MYPSKFWEQLYEHTCNRNASSCDLYSITFSTSKIVTNGGVEVIHLQAVDRHQHIWTTILSILFSFFLLSQRQSEIVQDCPRLPDTARNGQKLTDIGKDSQRQPQIVRDSHRKPEIKQNRTRKTKIERDGERPT